MSLDQNLESSLDNATISKDSKLFKSSFNSEYLSIDNITKTEIPGHSGDQTCLNLVYPSTLTFGSDRIVATLFCRKKNTHPSNLTRCFSGSTPSPSSDSNLVPPSLTTARSLPNSLPKSSINLESIDPFHGSYISPICLASFMKNVSSNFVSNSSSTVTSSHRYLDHPTDPRVVELIFSFSSDSSCQSLCDLRQHQLISQFESEWYVDITLQQDTVFRRYPRLVCFDMDSTLIEQETIDLIAESIGVGAEVSALTRQAMNGELDFLGSLTARAKLLRGAKEDIFKKLQDIVTPTKGVVELMKALRRMGVRTAVFSGGFLPLVSWLSKKLSIDYAHANTLSVSDGLFTGEIEGEIVDAERKRALLHEISLKEGISLDQVVAVGDGANDILMLGAAGLGVAWNAKPQVQMKAHARLNGESLLDLLYFFGLTSREISLLIS